MIEVEVKARAEKDTQEKIKALGAKLLKVENHHDLYFNSPLRDFKVSDEALRIRIKEEGARLTTNLLDCDLKDIRIGMPVEAAYEDITDEITLLQFRPAGK